MRHLVFHMWKLSLLVALALTAGACKGQTAAPTPTSRPTPNSAVDVAFSEHVVPTPAGGCAVTSHVRNTEPIPSNAWRDGFPVGTRWFRSEDGRLLTWAEPGWKSSGVKLGWIKPVGAQLEISGRRLDGDAPPIEASFGEGYPGDFQASGLTFPTEGCWQIRARAGGSELEFVVYVPR